MMIELMFLMLGVLLFIGFSHISLPPFQDGDHGLAYITEKKMFMLTTLSVTGKSYDVSSRIEFNLQRDQFKVHISLPVESLDSGMYERDKSVQDFLQIEEHQNIAFTSDWMPYDSLNFDKHLSKKVSGLLCFSGKQYSVEFPLHFVRQENFTRITGVLESTFTRFDMACPRVVGGLVADVKDRLDIIVNLRSDKIDGLEELLATKKEVSELG